VESGKEASGSMLTPVELQPSIPVDKSHIEL
jgi:hypothetical protein